ncbi:MAG: thiolase family protein [Sphingomonadales bacterium]|nr:thiolase family protein [Sphingomonadales bacterium]MBU3992532.1 thiolase family protein [Alphaproteobacteria bacterium]
MRPVYIAGVGIHKFGRFDDKPYTQMGLEAATMALADAKMPWSDVQLAYCARMYLPATSGVKILGQLGRTGISIVDIEAACASGGAALVQACMAIASGAKDTALVLGVEKMPRGFMDPRQLYEDWQIKTGLSQNPIPWAIRARRHMHEHGTTAEQIAKISVKNHRNSVHNPNAMYQKEFSLEQVLNSPLVNDPINLFSICAPNEGAAAVVLCSGDVAAKYTDAPIEVAGCAHKVALYTHFSVPLYTVSARVENPHVTQLTCGEVYEAAGIGPEDIDVLEVQDTDAFCELEAYEHIGLCPIGEGGRLIDDGTVAIGGSKPVNTSGGLISKGEPVGASHLGQIHEIVSQLRGTAGARQVEGAKVGLAHVIGAGGNCAVTVLKR